MEYARSCLPEAPPGGVTAGIGWASADHVACVVDGAGRVISRFTVPHTAGGLSALVKGLARVRAAEVATGRGDGPMAEALLEAGFTVVVISPSQVRNPRSRYGPAGNKDDRFDAFVLAGVPRTDRARLRPLACDAPATVTPRGAVRARRDLAGHRVALCSQPRAHLDGAFPGAVGLFAGLDSAISLAFLARSGCQDRASWLSGKRMAAWLRSAGYSGRTTPGVPCQRLAAAPRGATGGDGAARAHITRALLAVLTSLVTQISALAAQIAEQPARRADARIFTSLPRAGTVRAARLLAEIGDCRARFPAPEPLMCLAGVAPSTRQSGKHKSVTFRWAAGKQLRDAVCDFAGDSRRASPRAAKLYGDATARGKDHPHATRILARAWLYVIWPRRQNGDACDPARHKALQRVLAAQPSAARAA